jgi:hypothetical protein
MRTILALESDDQAGHKLGLCPPGITLFELDREGNEQPFIPELTDTQIYLWELRKWALDEIVRLADGSPIVFTHNGDATQGLRYPEQLMSDRMCNHILIARENAKSIMTLPKLRAVRYTFGTGNHVFGEGSSEVLIVEFLKAEFPKADVRASYNFLSTIGGAQIDISHHGPTVDSRYWLRGNMARYYLRNLMMKEMKNGKEPPALVVRAHYHDFITEIVRVAQFESRLVITPSMCGMSDYANKSTKSEFEITNGLIAFEISGGIVSKPYEFTKTLDIRTKEEIL